MGLEEAIASKAERLHLELDALGREVVEDIQNTLDEGYPPASEPGEAPHRRSGELQAGISYVVEDFVDAASEVRITSSARHTRYLEKGTSRMEQRPFLAPAREKWRTIWRDRARKAVQR